MKLSKLQALLKDCRDGSLVWLVSIPSGQAYPIASVQSDNILEIHADVSNSKPTFKGSELYEKLSGLDPELPIHVTVDNSAFPVKYIKVTSRNITLNF